jgi:hypothetical protein
VYHCCKYLQIACSVTAVSIAGSVLVGCTGNSEVNGHPASTLSGGPNGVRGSSTGESSHAGSKGRPSRPGSVSSIFSSIPNEVPCGTSANTVTAGSTDIFFTIQELQEHIICITGLSSGSVPIMLITTPTGARHTVTAHPFDDMWEWSLTAGPGEGPVDSVGDFKFEVLTTASTSATPTTSPTSPSAPATVSPTSTAPLTSPSSISTTSSNTTPRGPSAGRGSLASAHGYVLASLNVDSVAASGRLTVVAPPQPTAVIPNGPRGFSAGDQLQVSLAGFPANSAVFLTLYGPGTTGADGSKAYPLLADLPAARSNAAGEALVSWQLPSGISSGEYGVWMTPAARHCFAQQACVAVFVH